MTHEHMSARGAAFAGLIAAALIASPAPATPQSGFAGAQVLRTEFGDLDIKTKADGFSLKLDTKGNSDIYVTRNTISGNGTSGWHTHPGPSLITVTAGAILAYDADLCTPTRYGVGDSFVDEGGHHVHLLRNESATAAAETIAIQFLPAGADRRIDAPQPNNCNF